MRRTRHTRRAAAALAALLALGAVAGCGEKTLDSGDAEDKIADEIEEQRSVRPDDVNCPDDMKAKKGETYRCEITENAGKIGVTITMTDDDGGFRFEVDG